ncbi:hypothetical protein PHET_02453, partial [Paragonimus heterotremus]
TQVRRKLARSFEVGLVSVITIFPYGNNLIGKFKMPIKRKLRDSEMDLPELWHVRLIGAVKMAVSRGPCKMNFLLPVVKDEDFKIQINMISAPEGQQFEDKPCDLVSGTGVKLMLYLVVVFSLSGKFGKNMTKMNHLIGKCKMQC